MNMTLLSLAKQGRLYVSVVSLTVFLFTAPLVSEDMVEERCEYPVWSVKTQDTGAERIAYALVSKIFGTQIWAINTDAARNKLMLTSMNWSRHPFWSWDGKRIAFAGGDEKQVQQIYIMTEDGTEQQKVTSGPEDKLYPVFSPKGDRLIYLSVNKNEASLYEVAVDKKSSPVLVAKCGKIGKDTVLNPIAYSPDGASIAYVKLDANFRNQNIYILSTGTKEEKQATTQGYIGSGLAWSPDGTKLAFASTGRGKGYSIYVKNVSTGEIKEMITTVTPLGVAWSPDSKRLCFLRNYQVWIADEDGKNQRQMTSQEIVSDPKAWQNRKVQNLQALKKLKEYIGRTVWLKKTITTYKGELLEKLSEAKILNVRNKLLLPKKYRVVDDSLFGLEIELRIKKKKFFVVYLYESDQYAEDFSKFFFMNNPYTAFGWPVEIWEAIKAKQVLVGMNKTQVMLALGEPSEMLKSSDSISELWDYKFFGKVTFVDEKVVSFEKTSKEFINKAGVKKAGVNKKAR
ncbi:MAG: hypothetical protein NTX32_07380 [Candidatus Firestonebacteria bacterium]|nr:hypothetical protein [Candidatus Firestonebacteria bacterium]